MKINLSIAVLFFLTIGAVCALGQKTDVMADIPDVSSPGTDRTVRLTIHNPNITNVVIMDKGDVENATSEQVGGNQNNVTFTIPAGKTFAVSTFASGNRAALEKWIISVSSTGAISFGPSARANTDVEQQSLSDGANRQSVKASQTTIRLRLQAAPEVKKGPTVKVQIHRENLEPKVGVYVLEVKNGNRTQTEEVQMGFDSSKKSFPDPLNIDAPIYNGENTITVYPKIGKDELKDEGDQVTIKCTACKETADGSDESANSDFKLNDRLQAYFGTEIVGASAAASDAQPFFDLKINLPIKEREKCRNLEFNLRCFAFWADFRFASTPTQTLPDFTGLTPNGSASFFGSNQSASVNQLVKSFQTKIGLEVGLGENFSLIGGAGLTSPLSSRQSVQVFKIPRLQDGTVIAAFQDIFGHRDYTGIDNLVLTTGERDRFLRNYFFGGRLRYPIYVGDDGKDINPAEFDLTLGQDEAITKKFVGAVLRFDATIPVKLGDREVLYFGAGFGLRMTGKVNVVTVPFFLEPVANFNLFGNNNLVTNLDDTPFGTSNRDNYSFRVGVDIIRLIFGNKDKTGDAAAVK